MKKEGLKLIAETLGEFGATVMAISLTEGKSQEVTSEIVTKAINSAIDEIYAGWSLLDEEVLILEKEALAKIADRFAELVNMAKEHEDASTR